MTKKFYSFASILLTSLIALLGFGSCKTSKKAMTESEGPLQMSKDDSIRVGLIDPPGRRVKPAEPIKLLYGAPPVKVVTK